MANQNQNQLIILKSLNSIPYEIYKNIMIRYLDMTDIGNLAKVSKILRDIFNEDNDIWKYLYIKIWPLKVKDTSVHIFPNNLIFNGKKQTNIKTEPIYWNTYNRVDYISVSHCNCGFHKLIKSMRNLIGTLYTQSEINTYSGYICNESKNVQDKYYEYIKKININYNKYKGFSTVNLCQNIEHYDIETLGNAHKNINRKSFKKHTIQILITRKNKTIRILENKKKKLF